MKYQNIDIEELSKKVFGKEFGELITVVDSKHKKSFNIMKFDIRDNKKIVGGFVAILSSHDDFAKMDFEKLEEKKVCAFLQKYFEKLKVDEIVLVNKGE